MRLSGSVAASVPMPVMGVGDVRVVVHERRVVVCVAVRFA